MSTPLRTIVLLGPRLAGAGDQQRGDRNHAWIAELKVAYMGPDRLDRALVDSTLGMRVMLQSPMPDVMPGTAYSTRAGVSVPLHSPQLLALVAGPGEARKARVEFCAQAGMSTAPASYPIAPCKDANDPWDLGSASLLAMPEPTDQDGMWPMPQTDGEIEVPTMRLVEGRLSVLVDAGAGSPGAPVGFLSLLPEPGAGALAFVASGPLGTASQLPWIRLRRMDAATPGASPPGGSIVITPPSPWQNVESPDNSVNASRASELPRPMANPVKVDLTPDGIEFDAEVANPGRLVDSTVPTSLPVRLRLVQQGDGTISNASWVLMLVDDARYRDRYGEIARMLDVLQSADAPPKLVDFSLDTRQVVPAVAWPLYVTDNGTRLVYDWSDISRPGPTDFRLDLVARAAVTLLGDADEGSDLPTAVELKPDRLRLTATDFAADAATPNITLEIDSDRRQAGAASSPQQRPRPSVRVNWELRDPVTLAVQAGEGNRSVLWTLDEDALARDLRRRYARAGVLPDSTHTTYGFLAVADGWLQWPLSSRDAQSPEANLLDSGAAALDGELVFDVDTLGFDGDGLAKPPRPLRSRRVRVSGCDRVLATVKFWVKSPSASGLRTLARKQVSLQLQSASGEASGLLWFATASPLPEEILPSLAAGPLALDSPWLSFGRFADSPANQSLASGWRQIAGSDYRPRPGLPSSHALTLTDGPTPEAGAPAAIYWQRADGLPVVTAMPMTRTVPGSTAPLASRQLLPRVVSLRDWQVVLTTADGGAGTPTVVLTDRSDKPQAAAQLPLLHQDQGVWTATNQPGGGAASWVGLPLVSVTLPGIEFKPDPGNFDLRQIRLCYDLPVLGECHAMAALPRPAGAASPAVQSPPVRMVTSLDPDALREVWLDARDRLLLTRTQGGVLSAGWVGQDGSQSFDVDNLLEGARWSTMLKLSRSDGQGQAAPFGTLQLGKGQPANGPAATLAGYTGRFTLTPASGSGTLETTDGNGEVLVVGFAPALVDTDKGWRDARGSVTAVLPAASGLVQLRAMRSEPDGVVWQRATLTRPLNIRCSTAPDRLIRFWFRDLPMVQSETAHYQDPDFDTPAMASSLVFRPGSDPAALGRDEVHNGPSPDSLEGSAHPSSTFEWRLANDPQDESPALPARDTVPLGVLEFRALRLLDVTVGGTASAQRVTRLRLLGTLGEPLLDASAPGTRHAFGPNPVHDERTVVGVTLTDPDGNGLSFATARWHSAYWDDTKRQWQADLDRPPELSIRIAKLIAGFGPPDGKPHPDLTTRALLHLGLAGGMDPAGLPAFAAASAHLDVVLFGQLQSFGGGTARHVGTAAGNDLDIAVSFERGAAAGEEVSLTQLDLSLAAHWLSVAGMATIFWQDTAQQGSALPLVRLQFGIGKGQELRWVNHRFATVTVTANHVAGLLGAEVGVQAAGVLDVVEPVAGLRVPKAWGQATLRLVTLRPSASSSPMLASALGVAAFVSGQQGQEGSPGIRGFSHTLRSTRSAPGPAQVSSDLRFDIDWTLQSRIRWPLAQVNSVRTEWAGDADGRSSRLKLPMDPNPASHRVQVRLSGVRMDTGLLTARFGQIELAQPWAVRAVAHHVLTRTVGAETATLTWEAVDCIVFTGTRTLAMAARRDGVEVVADSDRRSFAFAARYRKASQQSSVGVHGEPPKDAPSFVKAGLGLRQYAQAGFPTAPVAKALEGELQARGVQWSEDGLPLKVDGNPWSEDVIASGAGPVTFRYVGKGDPDDQAWLLALPWLACICSTDASGRSSRSGTLASLLPEFRQVSATADTYWDVSNIDIVAGAALRPSRSAPLAISLRSDSEAELRRRLDDALAPVHTRSAADNGTSDGALEAVQVSRALMPVEQVFMRRADGLEPGDISTQPLWLRSLLALGSIVSAQSASQLPYAPAVCQLLVSGLSDGRYCRAMLARQPAAAIPPAARGRFELVVLSRTGLAMVVLDSTDATRLLGTGGGNEVPPDPAAAMSRLVELARLAVPEPIAATLTRQDAAGQFNWCSDIVLPAPDADDAFDGLGSNAIAPGAGGGAPPPRSVAAYPSPHRGWCTLRGGWQALGQSAVGMGDDRPFQDGPVQAVPADADPADPAVYGSGLSGRCASLSFGARAYGPQSAPAGAEAAATALPGDAATEPVPSDATYLIGWKTFFNRADDVPLRAPPARHLTPSHARLLLPTHEAAVRALAQADGNALAAGGEVLAFIPPQIQRLSFGRRPGVLHAEYDGLAFTFEGQSPLDRAAEQAALPGHLAPLLARAVRTPRGVAFPQLPLRPGAPGVFDTLHQSFGRRTFVAEDDLDAGGIATPFRWFRGVATVIRTAGLGLAVSVPAQETKTDAAGFEFGMALECKEPLTVASLARLLGILPGALPHLPVAAARLRLNSGLAASFLSAQWSATGSEQAITLTLRFRSVADIAAAAAGAAGSPPREGNPSPEISALLQAFAKAGQGSQATLEFLGGQPEPGAVDLPATAFDLAPWPEGVDTRTDAVRFSLGLGVAASAVGSIRLAGREVSGVPSPSLHFRVSEAPVAAGAADFRVAFSVASPAWPPTAVGALLLRLGILPHGTDSDLPSAALTVGQAGANFVSVAYARSPATSAPAIGLTFRFTAPPPVPATGADASLPSEVAGTVCRLLNDADGDTPVVMSFTGALPAGLFSAPPADGQFPLLTIQAAAGEVPREDRIRFALRLPIQPVTRASMQVPQCTLVFGDPAYDRLLCGPGASVTQRDSTNKPWKLAADRFQYSQNTPIHFAFGPLVVAAGPKAGEFDGNAADTTGDLTITRLRTPTDDRQAPSLPLAIAGVAPSSPGTPLTPPRPTYQIKANTAYVLTLDRLLTTVASPALDIAPGDRLQFTLSVGTVSLSLVLTVAAESPVPPSPAVYTLLTLPDAGPAGGANAQATADAPVPDARVALHAARPLPSRIEFPSLLQDLALGHIRRMALFEWRHADAAQTGGGKATLVKIDSAGGGQLPASERDLCGES